MRITGIPLTIEQREKIVIHTMKVEKSTRRINIRWYIDDNVKCKVADLLDLHGCILSTILKEV